MRGARYKSRVLFRHFQDTIDPRTLSNIDTLGKRLRIPFGIDRSLPGPPPHLAATASVALLGREDRLGGASIQHPPAGRPAAGRPSARLLTFLVCIVLACVRACVLATRASNMRA